LPAPAKLTKPAPSSEIVDSAPAPPAKEAARTTKAQGQFIASFSYSGPSTAVCVQQGACDGAKIFADRDYVFKGLPEALKGSDWIQTANADNSYSAVDLMEFSAKNESTIYVAHDDRLPRPEWLRREFKPTPRSLMIEGKPMKLF